ncbi:MerR family transcriptional regulator [Paenibacillus beijingensis]|uniref:MerR family transcriptional regulator n=1 Tax=Paenibacillus beijingensis TaxID=1126833 RepID=UPI0009E1B2A2|nr:MerR family transcriptional regulator [Paenibacillus beijingensis]
MRIKELADKLNISPRAVRFYEEKGILSPSKHPDNNYRIFTEQDARRLQTIISLREVGMSLEEIKSVLEELDRGEQDEVLYALELQRSVMFSQWVELKLNIEAADGMISQLKANRSLAWDDIFQLAQGLKRLRDQRSSWRDQWDFDRQASFHDELVLHTGEQSFNRHPEYKRTLKLIREWIHPIKGEKGLDIATGTGNLAALFMECGIAMAGIDQSKEMLKMCRRKFPEMETKLGNFLAIPYLDSSFDFAVSSYALHHLTEEQKLLALAEMRRVLNPHGRICIADLMFENEAERAAYIDNLSREDKPEWVDFIRQQYYADRSRLLQWFSENGYFTRSQQMSDLLHIIYAVPIALDPGGGESFLSSDIIDHSI